MSITKKQKVGIIVIAALGCTGLLYAGLQSTPVKQGEKTGQPQYVKAENTVKPVMEQVREHVEEVKQAQVEQQAKEEAEQKQAEEQAQSEAPIVQQVAPTPEPETVYTAPPVQEVVPPSGPSMGDTKDGMIYIEGFGWIPDEGGGSQGTESNMNPNGNKIGTME